MSYKTTDFTISERATHPSNEIKIGQHIFVVDSRQRNCKYYPSPSSYSIPIPQVFKNITSIELKGCIIPKSSYNIHSTNNRLDFSIGDTVTEIRVTNTGRGYTAPPLVTITPPTSGTTATATAVLNSTGGVASILITVAGTGYRTSTPPLVFIDPPTGPGGYKAQADAYVGTVYQADLRPGNYIVGGNPESASTYPTDLLLELQNAMNYAVNGPPYNPTSTSPFEVRIVSQYPELGAAPGTPEAFDTNACRYNRIQIINVNSDHWELLFCSGKNSNRNLRRVLGFPWIDCYEPVTTPSVTIGAPKNYDLIPAGTSLVSYFDYDMMDYPEYIILNFWPSDEYKLERVFSNEGNGLNRAFAMLVYDSNVPNNLLSLSGSSTDTVGNVNYLTGALSKGTFYRDPGVVKALKGYDFDTKYLEFSPPISKLSHLNIDFTKFGTETGGLPNYYGFTGDDHLLIFQISGNDNQSGKKW